MPLSIAITGAGAGGMAAAIALALKGHKPVIYEAQKTISAVGAGIQIGANMGRLLVKLGVGDMIAKHASFPDSILLHRWQDGATIAAQTFEHFQDDYGIPYMLIHRHHLIGTLHKRALEVGVRFHLGVRVTEYDLEAPSATLDSKEVIRPDLLIVADGVRSAARDQLPQIDLQQADADKHQVFRVMVDVADLSKDEELKALTDNMAIQHYWLGPGSMVVSYFVENYTKLNMAFTCKRSDERDQSHYAAELHKAMEGWDRRLHKLIDLTSSPVTKWPMWLAPHLRRTVPLGGRAIVIGDAAHDLSPYLAQGAAMAIEDAMLLGKLLSDASAITDVPKALQEHEARRIPRTMDLGRRGLANRDLCELADGERQRTRDAGGIAAMATKDVTTIGPHFWQQKGVENWLYGYEVETDMPEPPALPTP